MPGRVWDEAGNTPPVPCNLFVLAFSLPLQIRAGCFSICLLSRKGPKAPLREAPSLFLPAESSWIPQRSRALRGPSEARISRLPSIQGSPLKLHKTSGPYKLHPVDHTEHSRAWPGAWCSPPQTFRGFLSQAWSPTTSNNYPKLRMLSQVLIHVDLD